MSAITLEEQLDTLAELGLTLNDGVTIDDLLYSFPREEYEGEPFSLILFVLGGEVEREPWGRSVCDRVWNFDTECINGTGDYATIVERLCGLAGAPGRLSEVSDYVDIDGGEATLEYTVNGQKREWIVEVNDDWADMMTVAYVMDDIESGDGHFFYVDNGQAMVLYYIDDDTAARLNELSGGALQKFLAD